MAPISGVAVAPEHSSTAGTGSGTAATLDAAAARQARVDAQIFARAARVDYERWAEQVQACGSCARPVRLRGRVVEQMPSGEQRTYSTADEPDGVLLKRCGNRRAAVCPSCSYEYSGDTWQLIAAGVSGGRKNVPETIAEHPKVFAAFTAPSFGAVHTTRLDRTSGKTARCRPRSRKDLCPHGRPTWCMALHHEDDARLGEPLCGDCYDYTAAVGFNWQAPELWRRFTIALPRVLARQLGLSERELRRVLSVQYAKVAEFQRRGVIHFHAIIRLDGPRNPHNAHPAPDSDVTADQLADAVRAAAAHVQVHTDLPARGHDGASGELVASVLRFGEQIDAVPLGRRPDLDAGELPAEAVAAYVAKYATKAAEDLGLGERRQIPDLHHAYARRLRPHVLAMLEATDQLAQLEDYAGIRRWLHMLGFRGHFSTKSRRYSTTLGAIRAERRTYAETRAARREHGDHVVDPGRAGDLDNEETTLVLRSWEYVGTGYLTLGDAALAAASAARARAQREAAHEARRCQRAPLAAAA